MKIADILALKSNKATIETKIDILPKYSGELTTTITNYNSVKSWTYSDIRYDEKEGFIGQFIARSLSCELKDITDDFNVQDREIVLWIGIKVGEADPEWYSLGNFLVDKPTSDEVKDNTKFTALDYTGKFNKTFNGDYTDDIYTKSFNEKLADNEEVNLLWLVKYTCAQAGVLLGSEDFVNKDFIIPDNQFNSDVQCRDVLKYAGKLAYSWVRIDWDNKVYIDFKQKSTIASTDTFTPDDYYTLETQKDKYGIIDKVVVGTSFIDGDNESDSREELYDVAYGKNLCNQVSTNKSSNAAGVILTQNAQYLGLEDKISVKPNTTYYIKLKDFEDLHLTSNFTFNYSTYNSSGTFIERKTGQPNNVITTGSDVYYIFPYYFSNNAVFTNTGGIVMMEKGNISSPYEPFIANGEKELGVFDNPITYTSELRKKALEKADAVYGLQYQPLKMNTTGAIWLKGNELIKTVDMEGKELETYPFNRITKYTGHIKTEIICPAQTETEKSVTYNGVDNDRQNIKNTRIIVDRQNQTITNIAETQTQIQQDMLLTKSQTGYPIEITDAGNYDLKENKIYGNSYQETEKQNLFNINNVINNVNINSNGQIISDAYQVYYIPVVSGATYEMTTGSSRQWVYNFFNGVPKSGSTGTPRNVISTNILTFTVPNGYNYLAFRRIANNPETIENISILYSGDIPSPDYPSEVKNVKGVSNLFDKNNVNKLNAYLHKPNLVITSSANDRTLYIPIKSNTTYTISKISSTRFRVGTISTVPKVNTACSQVIEDLTGTKLTITSKENDKYLVVFYWASSDTLTEQEILDSIMIEEGSISHNYVPYGTWLEEKTRGKNLTNYDNDTNLSNKYYSGAGVLTTDNTTLYTLETINVSPNTQYTLNFETITGTSYIRLCEFKKDGTFIKRTLLNTRNQTITTDGNTSYVVLNADKGTTKYFTNMMMEQGSTATTYEPYKENTILIDMNKPNLANISDIELGKSWAGDVSNQRASILNIPVKPNTQYLFDIDISSNSSLNATYLMGFNKIGDKSTTCYLTSSGYITTTSTTNYFSVEIRANVVMTSEMLKNVKIALYERPSPYYELCKIGDIQDELNVKTGVLTKRIGKVVLDGSLSENWFKSSTSNSMLLQNLSPNSIANNIVISNKFKSPSEISIGGHGNQLLFTPNTPINGTTIGNLTLEQWKQWLSNNPVEVYYVLEEPEIIQLDKYDLTMFEGYNYITVDGEVKPDRLFVTYYTPSKFNAMYATKSDLIITNENIQSSVSKSQELYSGLSDKLKNFVTEDSIGTLRTDVSTLQGDMQYQIDITKEWTENGISKVKTTTGFTFDEEGLTITKTSANTETNINENGMVIHSTSGGTGRDEELLNVNSEGVEAYNIKVKTYFHIGSHSRMEDYQDGTGIFYIG